MYARHSLLRINTFISFFICENIRVSKNDKEYFQRLKAVTSFDNSLLINTFPFTKEQKQISNIIIEMHWTVGKLHPDLIMNSHWWPHKRLPEGLQHGIAEAIIHTCESEMCKPIAKETKQDVALYVSRNFLKYRLIF